MLILKLLIIKIKSQIEFGTKAAQSENIKMGFFLQVLK